MYGVTCQKNVVHFGWIKGGYMMLAGNNVVVPKVWFEKKMVVVHIAAMIMMNKINGFLMYDHHRKCCNFFIHHAALKKWLPNNFASILLVVIAHKPFVTNHVLSSITLENLEVYIHSKKNIIMEKGQSRDKMPDGSHRLLLLNPKLNL